MVRIMNFKEYSEAELKKRLKTEYNLTEEGATNTMTLAHENPGKIVKSDITGAIIKYEASEGKMRWYLLK